MLRPDRYRLQILGALCVVSATLLVVSLFVQFAPLLELELHLGDLLSRSSFARKSFQNPQLIYLAIDHASVTLDGFSSEEIEGSAGLRLMKESWPWPRQIYALITERLVRAGARVVVFDLLFPIPREGDDVFRAALDKFASQVVIGSTFVNSSQLVESLVLQLPSSSLIASGSAPDDRVGFVNFWPDADETVRSVRYETTAAEVYGIPGSSGQEALQALSARALEKSGRTISGAALGKVRLRFTGGPGTYRAHSLCDIFDEKIWNATQYKGGTLCKDKIVMIGPQGHQFKDQLQTPFGLMDGAELQLNAINAGINNDWIRELPAWANALLIILSASIGWLISVLVHRPFLRLTTLACAAVACLVLAQIIFNVFGVLFATGTNLLTLGGSGIIGLAYDLVLERVTKLRLRHTLERYVSRDLVKDILDCPETYLDVVGGVRREVTVLFSDIRGFTAMSEQSDSQQVVARLNEYFRSMVKHVFENHGSLDKFMGDAIMAVWGTIRSQGAACDTEAAVTTALQMQESLKRLNEDWRQRGLPELGIGIGINHGEAIAGNFGSEEKMELTVIGDAVNLASRIQDLTKEYQTSLLLGENAARLVADSFHLQTVDRVQVVGRSTPVTIFTVLGRKEGSTECDASRYLRKYEHGLVEYWGRNFSGALIIFDECLQLRSHDSLAVLYRDRSLQLVEEFPGEEWDGVVIMEHK